MDVERIKRDAGKVLLRHTKKVARRKGRLAAKNFLESEISILAAAAYSALGPEDACRLMFNGFEVAEAMAAENARP